MFVSSDDDEEERKELFEKKGEEEEEEESKLWGRALPRSPFYEMAQASEEMDRKSGEDEEEEEDEDEDEELVFVGLSRTLDCRLSMEESYSEEFLRMLQI